MLSGLFAIFIAVFANAADHSLHTHKQVQVLAPGYQILSYNPPRAGDYTLPAIGEAADGIVLDSLGLRHHLHDLYDGKVVVLSFIYTSCNDVNGCPLASFVLSQTQRQLIENTDLKDKVRLISVSFDPTNDSPQVMRKYRKIFARPGIDWRFLTADSETRLEPLLKAYGQSFKQNYDEQGNFTGTYSHILRVFLIDRQKRIRNIYSISFLHADTLVNDIKTLFLSESGNHTVDLPQVNIQDPGDYKQEYATVDNITNSKSLASRKGKPANLLRLVKTPPRGLPPTPIPADNPLTHAKVTLGRKLFYDRRLSHNNTISCAMCHIPEQGFTVNEMATAVGIEGRSVRRNAPSLYNVAYAIHLFHDSRETTLEQQIWSPLLAANEMGNPSVGYVVERLRNLPDYNGLFVEAFEGRGPGMETIGMAIAAYERTLVSANSRFDRWYFGREADALTPAAERGFELFNGKGGCSTCHRIDDGYALFTDNKLHNTGIGYQAAFPSSTMRTIPLAPGKSVMKSQTLPSKSNDLGRYEITQDPADRWKYKTPSLRNVELTAPYMHDGSIGSLHKVVEFYNRGGIANENLDPLIRPLGLSSSEVNEMVAFLHSLTGDNINVIVADALAAPVGDP